MFTGIIEELGRIRRVSFQGSSGQIAIQAKKVLEGTKIGDSTFAQSRVSFIKE